MATIILRRYVERTISKTVDTGSVLALTNRIGIIKKASEANTIESIA